jgi:N-acetylglucosaminyldiphosphoundecaprenol N-acetyl-beta-D-mannosaminyltransferase
MQNYNIPAITPERRFILKMPVDATSYNSATQLILAWAKARKSSYVCIANVHMVMESYDSPAFAEVVNNAALVTSDGMPLVWALRLLGVRNASRVYGPTLMLHICEAAAQQRIPIGLYGGKSESLTELVKFLQDRFEGIQVVCTIAPPFRPLTPEENKTYTEQICQSGAQILFAGIGCPKQEFWMASQVNRIPAVMLGIGAAFDFHSGRVKQASPWMQALGLEWLFRLFQDPRRLWKRYIYHNPRFVFYFLIQWGKSLLNANK